jgi:hypothetical protein
MSAGFVEFEFDLPEALLVGLTSKLKEMAATPLIKRSPGPEYSASTAASARNAQIQSLNLSIR